jgi:para-aminobenzoate synthetase/4-amino-4-deoxychorismate lyase
MTVFALLDDGDSSAAKPTSRLYTGFLREHRCTDPAIALAASKAAVLSSHPVLVAWSRC